MQNFKTPTIPEWIMRLNHPGYANIFDFRLGNRNLWGTETLLGDWDGEVLLVAKDFYPASYIRRGIEVGVPNPYRHKPRIPTNSNLVKTLRYYGMCEPGVAHTECNFLYISACFLLRDDGIISGELPDRDLVLAKSAPVVRFTIENMPNIRQVVTLGRDSQSALAMPELRGLIREAGLRINPVSHPARAMSDVDRFAEWRPVFIGQL